MELDKQFYLKTLREDRQRSYKLLAKLIQEEFHPDSVVDFGCGAGWVLYYCQVSGISDIVGCEPNYNAQFVADESVSSRIIQTSLAEHLDLRRQFDLAVSLEVAEHIPSKFSHQVIENICRHSKNVLFSAAYPGQGGVGHVNEQKFEYWENHFNSYGFVLDKPATRRILRALKKGKANHWYYKNCRVLRCK